MKALVTELIGTFFLVLVVGLAVNGEAALAPLAIGFTLMAMVYAGSRISGAHYNPAVSLAAVIRGALPAARLLPYWGAQVLGGVVAGFLVWKFTGHPAHVAPDDLTTPLKAVVGEAAGTFALAYVVLHTASSTATAGNGYFGFAIGATFTAFVIALGPLTGGAFNPAIGLGPAAAELALGTGASSMAWVYAAGPLLGAAAAGLVHRYQDG